MVTDLRAAVDAEGIDVYCQPKARLLTGEVVGVEALVQWQHPQYGFISPDEFIPIADHTDLMVPLTVRVLSTALQQCAAWHRQDLPMSAAVNLAPRTLLDPELPDIVASALHDA